MNRYVVRTSLVWLALCIAAIAIWDFKSRSASPAPTVNPSDEVQPVASGPAPGSNAEQPPAIQPEVEGPQAPVQLTPEQRQQIGVKTGTVEYKQLSDDIRAAGTVQIDERRISYVQVRFAGYVRSVFANATYQYVTKGDPLFTIYSPDLVATEQEFLLARRNSKTLGQSTIDGVASGASSLSAAAEQRLLQWDVSATDIAKLKQTGQPITDVTVYSPASGYITERNALPNMTVEPATRLYTIADLSRVWIDAQVFQNDVSRLKPGDAAEITVDSYPARTFSGSIEEILPQVDLATRTVHVRLAIANPKLKLKPGMFVNVDLRSNLGRQLAIPASAVLQSGTRELVFLNQGNGQIVPKEITTGARVGDDLVVLSGLKVHQPIVTSANFLIDSESQLQAAAGSYVPPPSGSGEVSATGRQAQAAQANIEFTTTPNPPQKGSNTFRVKLSDSSGLVSGADVSVTFSMPAMPAMGMAAMNTAAKLSDKGNGIYEGTGSLGSGGTWHVTITAQKSGQVIAIKQMSVGVTGGM
jgi:RND family efflux transporter MFP subunit